MRQIKSTMEVKTYSEDEAQAYIDALKDKSENRGYEVTGYSITKKEKKSKGEVIAEGFLVKATLVYSGFWDDLELEG